MVKSLCMTVFIALLIAAGAPALAAEGSSPKVQEMLQQAWALERQMHKDITSLNQAEAILDKVIEMEPGNVEGQWRMAEILFKQASNTPNPETAEQIFLRALEYAERSLEMAPNDVHVMYWMGCINARMAENAGVLKALGRIKAAKKYLQAAIDVGGEHRFATLSYAILGLIHASTPWPMKDMDKAMNYCRTAIDRDPNLTLARLHMAKVLIKDKQFDKAREQLDICLGIKKPTYIWDSEMKDWPAAKDLLKELPVK